MFLVRLLCRIEFIRRATAHGMGSPHIRPHENQVIRDTTKHSVSDAHRHTAHTLRHGRNVMSSASAYAEKKNKYTFNGFCYIFGWSMVCVRLDPSSGNAH